MDKKTKVQYLANVLAVAYANGEVLQEEQNAIDVVKSAIVASDQDYQEAIVLSQNNGFHISAVGSYAYKIKNIEDMLFVGMIDQKFDPSEQKTIIAFAKDANLRQEQLNEIISDVKKRVVEHQENLNIKTSNDNPQYDFRKTIWGMSKNDVKSSEGNVLLAEVESYLVFEGIADNHACKITYTIQEEKLVNACYAFTKTYSNYNNYINDYELLKISLIKKYGKPEQDTQVWEDNLYKEDINDWGFAVSLGHLTYLAEWKTIRTDILLLLSGNNNELQIQLNYKSRLHDDIIERTEKAIISNDL